LRFGKQILMTGTQRSVCPLRERREDIPRLARHFLQVAARELGVEAKLLHPETEAALTRLAWPGGEYLPDAHAAAADER
ncbi:hypothetical protein ACUODJ_59315, partial [Escherichia sp. HC-CC]